MNQDRARLYSHCCAAVWCFLVVAATNLSACSKADQRVIAQGAAHAFGGTSGPGREFESKCVTYGADATRDSIQVSAVQKRFEIVDRASAVWRKATDGWIAAFPTRDEMTGVDSEDQIEFDFTQAKPTTMCPNGTALVARMIVDNKELSPFMIAYTINGIERSTGASSNEPVPSVENPGKASPSPIVPLGNDNELTNTDTNDAPAGKSMLSGASGLAPSGSDSTSSPPALPDSTPSPHPF